VQRRFLLDVVVGQGAAVLQLLAGKDQALLVRGDACRKRKGNRTAVSTCLEPVPQQVRCRRLKMLLP
jgi:hypothetical protein